MTSKTQKIVRLRDSIIRGLTAKEIALKMYPNSKYLPISQVYSLVKRHLPELEEQLRVLSSKSRSKKHALSLQRRTYNAAFFDVWSPEMAWVLGFFIADGCLYFKNKKPTFEVGSTDMDVILKIQKLMETDYQITTKITIRNGKRYKDFFQLGIYNCPEYQMALKKLGIGPRKSLTIKCPEIPSKFFMHFLRGYLDGDGTVSGKSISFCSGSKNFLEEIAIRIDKRIKRLCGPWFSSNVYAISYGNKTAYRLGQLIYHNSTANIRMNRKYKKWEELQCLVNYQKIWQNKK